MRSYSTLRIHYCFIGDTQCVVIKIAVWQPELVPLKLLSQRARFNHERQVTQRPTEMREKGSKSSFKQLMFKENDRNIHLEVAVATCSSQTPSLSLNDESTTKTSLISKMIKVRLLRWPFCAPIPPMRQLRTVVPSSRHLPARPTTGTTQLIRNYS